MTTPIPEQREPSAMTYVVVWLVLAVLAAGSLLASYASLGDWNIVVAFAIAALKATLVLAVFMHLAYGPVLHRIVIAVAFGFVGLIILGVLADVATRSVAGPDADQTSHAGASAHGRSLRSHRPR
jgi:caa(3)-type oxidase subunit IV